MASIQILVGAGFTEGHEDPKNIEISETSESKQDAGTRSQDQSLEGLSFSFDTVNNSHTRQGDKTRSAVVLSELAKNNPEEFLKSLSKVFDDGKINLRDPIFENNAELIGLVKARCVPAESTQVIKFIDLLARSSEHDGVSDDSGFRMEFDSSQQDIKLGEDSTAHVVKYSYKQTATLEFNEKNIIITHENGNILTLSATKNPYQGSVSYTVGNDDAKNLGEAWNHDLKDIVVMFLATGKLETENHDDGNVWRIPSDGETKKSESINFLKDVAEGVKAKVAAEVEASEAEEGDAKLQGPTKEEVISKAIESWEHWQSNSMVKEKSWAYQPEGSHYLLVWESNKIFLEHESDDARQNDEWKTCEVDRVKSTIEDWITRKWDKFYPADKVSESSDKTSSTGSDLAADAGREAGHASFVKSVIDSWRNSWTPTKPNQQWSHPLSETYKLVVGLSIGSDDKFVVQIDDSSKARPRQPGQKLYRTTEGIGSVEQSIDIMVSYYWKKLRSPDPDSSPRVNSEAPAAPAGSAQASEHSSISESAGNIQVVDGLAALANAAQQVETRSQAPSDIPASSNSSQTTQSDGQTQIYKKGTSIANVQLKNATAKAAEYPTLDKHTSITSVSEIITKVKEAGGQALVEIRLQKSEETGHPKDGFRTKIIDLLGVTTVTDTNIAPEKLARWGSIENYKLKGGKTPGTSDCLAILREGSDGKFYVCMREFAFKAADGKESAHKRYIGEPSRSNPNKVFLPFNTKEDALSCIAYLSDDMTNIPALLQELIPDLKKIDYKNLVKPSDHYNKNLHFFEDATN